MGWFWGSNTSKKEDPTNSLDPSLKSFLQDQQPTKPYVPVEPPPQQPVDAPKLEKPAPFFPDTNRTVEDRPVPRESLFPDGRYAHLWKSYQPEEEVVVSTKDPVERLVELRKDRKGLIIRAAMENCAFEHEIMLTCGKVGTPAERTAAKMTLCKAETKQYNRCFKVQADFLKALGYMSNVDNTPEQEERIQMHADTLYHRMMDYETAVNEAKEKGTPIPPLQSLFNPSRPPPSVDEIDLPPDLMGKMHTHDRGIHELPPHERELLVKSQLQEAKMAYLLTPEMRQYNSEKEKERNARQSWLTKSLGEPIGKFMVPDTPKDPDDQERKKFETATAMEKRIWGLSSAGKQDANK